MILCIAFSGPGPKRFTATSCGAIKGKMDGADWFNTGETTMESRMQAQRLAQEIHKAPKTPQ